MTSLKAILTFLAISGFYLGAQAQALSCQSLFTVVPVRIKAVSKDIPDFIKNLPEDLSLHQRNETRNLTPSEVRKLNQKTLKDLENYFPKQTSDRAASASLGEIQNLLKYVEDHPVVSPRNKMRYQKEDVDIGYCFGRATFLHLALLKMGLQKNSILKIWAMGPHKNPISEVNWGFHVATVAFVKGHGWMSIDTNTFKVQPVAHWIMANQEHSTDGKMRFYVSTPERFGTNVPQYSRLQLGLDVPREKDWYQHYFVDLLNSIRGRSLEDLGLQPIRKTEHIAPAPQKPGIWGSFKDFIW